MLKSDRRRLVLRVNTLLRGAPVDVPANARSERAFREAATSLLVAAGAAIPIDWRSPPDEIQRDLAPFFGRDSDGLRQPIPEDSEAKTCLEILAGRVPKRTKWRLGWIDQSSDTYLVVRVRDEASLSRAIAEADLGRLRLFSPHAEARTPVARKPASPPKAAPKRASPSPVVADSAASYRTWKELVQGVEEWNDHGLLVRTAQDERVREVVRAHVRLAPKAVARTLVALLALLDGADPTGDLDTQLEAVRYFSFQVGSLERVLELLADLAARVETTANLRRFLLATRLPAFADTAADAASRLPAQRLSRLVGVLERGLKSKDPGTLCAAIDSVGRLGLSSLQPQVAHHARSSNALVKQSAVAAVGALKKR